MDKQVTTEEVVPIDPKLNVRVRTTFGADQVVCTLSLEGGDALGGPNVQELTHKVMSLQDEGTRRALLELGWAAPGTWMPAPPQQAQGSEPAKSGLVEAVTKAILFADCGSGDEWADNTDLGKAAIAVCDAYNPPRCSYCHAATSVGVWPAQGSGEAAELVRRIKETAAHWAYMSEIDNGDAAREACRKHADLLRQLALLRPAQGEAAK